MRFRCKYSSNPVGSDALQTDSGHDVSTPVKLEIPLPEGYPAQNLIVAFNMSAFSLRLPDSIHRHIKELAQQEGVSINQFIATAVAEKYPPWQRKVICKLGRNGRIAGLLLICWLRLWIGRHWWGWVVVKAD